MLLPFELQKAMAAEAEGTRIAKAKIIESQGEIKAAENLREASRLMMENPQILLVRKNHSQLFLLLTKSRKMINSFLLSFLAEIFANIELYCHTTTFINIFSISNRNPGTSWYSTFVR